LNEMSSPPVPVDSWAWAPGLVIDCMEEASGYLQFEVMFQTEVGWWDDYELKLVEAKNNNNKKGE